MWSQILLIFLSFFSLTAQSGPIPGGLYLKYGIRPASDLMFEGRQLLPFEAHQLFRERSEDSNGRWTLAELDPAENSYWKKTGFKKAPEIEVNEFDELELTNDQSLARSDYFRVITQKGLNHYEVYFGPKVHNFLIMKALLEKLGYKIPAAKHLKNIKINFKDEDAVEDFISEFEYSMGLDPGRWIAKKKKKQIVFQDVVIFNEVKKQTNLAKYFLDDEYLLENRRIFNALVVPYSLLDIPQSINMVRWSVGRIKSNNILFHSADAKRFRTPIDDALWITKRILDLDVNDWEEIVAAGKLPQSVSRILFEKLKARRNNLGSLFSLDNDNLPVESQLNDEDGKIVNGKLTQENYPGYARRFKIPDPDSPLSFSEMSSFFKSKAISEGINLSVAAFNQIKYLSTDLKSKLSTLESEFATKLEHALENNIPLKSIIDSYVYPTASGGVLVSRNIVAGSYLGTDNSIQLVDNIGINMSVGLFGGVIGVFSKTGEQTIINSAGEIGRKLSPVSLKASTNAFIRRTYSHIRPITSIQKALKYPFKNMVVPVLKNKISKNIDPLHDENFTKLEPAKQNEVLQSSLKALKAKLNIGESLIITDSIGVGFQGEAGMNLYQVAKLKLRASPQKVVVSRTHITRRSEHVFHLYKDFGNINRAEVLLSLESGIPVVRVGLKGTLGKARTRFYNINIHPNAKNLKEKLLGLRQLLKNNSTKLIKKIKKPYTIKHQFSEKAFKLGIFAIRYNYLNSSNKISVYAPSGEKIQIYRRYRGHSKGLDYESYAQDLTDLLFTKILKQDAPFYTMNSTNPGNTFMGMASNKIVTMEGFVNEDKIEQPFIKISRFWNGWRIKKKKAEKILNDIKKKYGFFFFPSHILSQTKKFFLYNFNVNTYVYQEGINTLLNMEDEKLKIIFSHYHNKEQANLSERDILSQTGFNKFKRHKRRYLKLQKKKKYRKATNHLIKMFNVVEKNLTIYGLRELVGGERNLYSNARLDGFRIGDENGDQPFISNSFGEIGENNLRGPSEQIIDFIHHKELQEEGGSNQMLRGEFYINWLKERLI